MDPSDKHTLTHGGIGIITGAFGLAASFLTEIEQVLRILVLVLTVIATILSIRKLMGRHGSGGGAASIPLLIGIVALVVGLLITPGCGRPPGPGAPLESRPRTEGHTTLRGSDGRLYRLVRKGSTQSLGEVGSVDLWQPVGAVGSGLPAFTPRLQSASDTSDPIFTEAGVLE